MVRGRSAFTLIELLVAISIIALLITLLLPAIEGVRDAARVVGCTNNQHQIFIGLHTWAADNEGNFPPGQRVVWPSHAPVAPENAIWPVPAQPWMSPLSRCRTLFGEKRQRP